MRIEARTDNFFCKRRNWLNLSLLSFFGFFLPTLPTLQTIQASDISEIIEVRLASAELLLLDNREKEALQLITQNIRSKFIHLESYFVLSDLHLKRRRKRKAFKTIKDLITRLHGNSVVLMKAGSKFDSFIKTMEKPNVKALNAYFKLAQMYYNEASTKKASEKRLPKKQIKIYALAMKYFEFTKLFDYNRALSNYYLGLIESRLLNNQEAVNRFLEARNELAESEEDQEMVENIDYLLGATLLKQGRLNTGVFFLKNIYNNPDSQSGLREYANIYLDQLSEGSFLSFGVNLGFEINDNINYLNDTQKKNFNLFKSILIKEKAIYRTAGANIYYTSPNYKGFSLLLLGGLQDQRTTDRDLSAKDLRTYSFLSNLTWNSFKKSIFKLELSYYHTLYRARAISNLQKFSGVYTIAPEITRAGTWGNSIFRLPITRSNAIGEGETWDKGFSYSYVPFYGRWFFNPSFKLSYTRAQEVEPLEDTNQGTFSISNHITPNPSFSLFQTIQYESYKNDNKAFAYKELSLSIGLSKTFTSIRGLGLNINLAKTNQKYDNDTEINNLIGDMNLSYYF